MKILVTGGAGFIGSHIVDAFLSAGHAVCVVDDLSTGFRHNLASGVPLHVVDIRDPQLIDVFEAEKPEVVCHQAARANVRESFEKPLLYAEVNVLGSLNVLECCRRSNVRKVIYASTGGAVYGAPSSSPLPNSTRFTRSIHTAPASITWSTTCTCTRKTSASRTHHSAIRMYTAPGRIPSERRESSPFSPGRCWTKAASHQRFGRAGKGFCQRHGYRAGEPIGSE